MSGQRLTDDELLGIALLCAEGISVHYEGCKFPTSSTYRFACRKLLAHITHLEGAEDKPKWLSGEIPE